MRAGLIPLICLVLGLGGQSSAAAAGSASIERVVISGTRYLRLGDWARANGLDVRWVRMNESVLLTNRSSRLAFAKDSREAEINGINVGLSHPVVLRNGAGYISEVDVATAIRPVLFPQVNASGLKVGTIVLDAGHGGRDPGYQEGSNQEKRYTLLLAQELRDRLKLAGYKVVMTRTTDVFVEPSVRAQMANRQRADLFISLHWNSAATGRNEVKGVQVFCMTPAGASSSNAGGEIRDAGSKPGNRNNEKNMFLAYQLQKSLVSQLGAEDRGIRRARFAVLSAAEMPAVLIEGGFMSHPTESKRIYDANYRRQMAEAIVAGVQAYKRQVQPGSR